MAAVTVVDSNVWIFVNLDDAPEHPAAKEKIAQLSTGGLHVNDIIVSEVFHKLSLYLGAEAASGRTRRMLDSAFVIYEPLGIEAVRRALSLALEHRMRINDALIAAHAIETRIPVLTDNTKDFRRIRGLRVLPLRS